MHSVILDMPVGIPLHPRGLLAAALPRRRRQLRRRRLRPVVHDRRRDQSLRPRML